MKQFKVWIYDSESGCEQPMICRARNESDARRKGNKYIRMWRLRDGSVTRVEVAVCCKLVVSRMMEKIMSSTVNFTDRE